MLDAKGGLTMVERGEQRLLIAGGMNGGFEQAMDEILEEAYANLYQWLEAYNEIERDIFLQKIKTILEEYRFPEIPEIQALSNQEVLSTYILSIDEILASATPSISDIKELNTLRAKLQVDTFKLNETKYAGLLETLKDNTFSHEVQQFADFRRGCGTQTSDVKFITPKTEDNLHELFPSLAPFAELGDDLSGANVVKTNLLDYLKDAKYFASHDLNIAIASTYFAKSNKLRKDSPLFKRDEWKALFIALDAKLKTQLESVELSLITSMV